jgi:type II restriction/modification system DNA methylase subunit YeeA
MLRDLFRAMANRNGRFGTVAIQWFNGGLFDDADVLPLGILAIRDLTAAARLDWKAIDPTIFGTLFESGLDDKTRAEMASLFGAPDPGDNTQPQLFKVRPVDRGVGIHYTDEATIMKIIEPVVVAPLNRDWERTKVEIRELKERHARARTPAEKGKLLVNARGLYADFRASLGRYRVLDPACGSGNFLALSLRALKDFDLAVLDDAAAMGLPPDDFRIGPEAVMGIEINAYAAELARLTVWITELQWQLRKGLGLMRRPILDKLDGIVRGDALLTQSGKDSEWPGADVVVGNPPFLGGKRIRRALGSAYVDRLFAAFDGRVPAEADLVAYWFTKAWERVHDGRLQRAGLVGTNSMRAGANRRVLDRIAKDGRIFDAWDDEPWVIKGAAVRVSLVCFDADKAGPPSRLDGNSVGRVNADLTSSGVDLTLRRQLRENANVCFVGVILNGDFAIDGQIARRWLCEPLNVNGRPNSDVLRPTLNGDDFNGTRPDKWVIDFGVSVSESEAAFYQSPFAHVARNVRPFRFRLNDDGEYAVRARNEREIWWRHARPRPAMRRALDGLGRYIATPMVSSYRSFGFLNSTVLPDQKLVVFARADELFLGIIHSRIHELWTIRTCSWIGAGNDVTYSNTSVFLTFPFPEGLTPNILAGDYADNPHAIAIAEAARRLNELRETWLNPPDLVEGAPEVVPGYPGRIIPVSPHAATVLKARTLTNLYNERPAWLVNAHRDLDTVVAAAYGWPADITEDEALE